MKPGLKIGLGIFTSLATAGFILTYDFYIKERIDSVEVVVVKASEEILKSEQILESKLVIERRPKEALIDDAILAEDLESIIGYDTKQEIVGNSMVSKKMVDFENMVPDSSKGESIRPITGNMIYAQPGSLRRKDLIDIYLIYPNGSTNLNKNGPTEVTSEEKQNSEKTNTSSSDETALKATKAFLKNIRVAYVKDSGNKEVVADTANEGAKDKRLNATSTISDLEVILNEEDFNNLMNEVLEKGAKLYITY